MLSRTLGTLGALLALFHVWLFATQAWGGELAEPGLLVRWIVAGGLGVAFAVLQRSGAPIFLGRKAVALWLLAALLHGPAVSDLAGRIDAYAIPEAVTIVVEIATASFALGLGWLLAASARRRARHHAPFPVRARADYLAATLEAGFSFTFAARPPPR